MVTRVRWKFRTLRSQETRRTHSLVIQ